MVGRKGRTSDSTPSEVGQDDACHFVDKSTLGEVGVLIVDIPTQTSLEHSIIQEAISNMDTSSAS